jgi:hypothetical protein
MKKLFLSLACIGVALSGYAQTAAQYDFSKFTPLQSTGTLPDVVEMSGKDFMAESRKNLTKGGTKNDKKAKESFVLQTSYAIKDLFVSGRILYNDPISDYVEKVRKEVTGSDPQLLSETRIFVIKSSVVNAFATNQGYLFITTGLLAQLENEAQLAFVICHELIHYKKKHVVKAYVQNDKLQRGDGGYRKSDVDKKYLAKSNYSKEHESEADVDGFDLFAKTRYSLTAIDGMFDVLKFSELPFEDYEFTPKTMLETEFLKFPIDYIQQELTVVEGEDEDKDDKYSTHPNLAKRRGDIADKIATLDGEDKKRTRSDYAVSEDLFKNARKLARYDLIHTNLINRQYDRAMYQAYCLLKDDPNNIYLKKSILRALYGLTKYANADRFEEVALKYSKVQGESQKLNYLLHKMESNELNVVALNFAWRLKKELRHNDTEVNLITEDIFYDMVKKHYPSKGVFSLEARTTPVDTVFTPEDKEDETSTKSKKKKTSTSSSSKKKGDDDEDKPKESRTSKLKKKKRGGADAKDDYITYAFVDLLKDKDFVDTYDRLAKETKKDKSTEKKEIARRKSARKNSRNYDEDDAGDDEDNEYLMDEKEVGKKYNSKWDCYALGVEKVLIVNPFYLKIDERKKTPVMYAGSDEARKDLNGKIKDISNDIKLDVEILDKQEFNAGSVDDYNDMGVLIDWMDERIDHKKLKMLPTDYGRIEDITKKHGTDYLGITGTINFVAKKPYKGLAVLISVVMPIYTWPFTIPYLIKKNTTTYVYNIVFNLKTGQPEMVNIGSAPYGDKNDIVNSFIYDHLLQMKRKGVSKNN